MSQQREHPKISDSGASSSSARPVPGLGHDFTPAMSPSSNEVATPEKVRSRRQHFSTTPIPSATLASFFPRSGAATVAAEAARQRLVRSIASLAEFGLIISEFGKAQTEFGQAVRRAA